MSAELNLARQPSTEDERKWFVYGVAHGLAWAGRRSEGLKLAQMLDRLEAEAVTGVPRAGD